MSKNFAFTLAEVLITLGIIGVVAALTLPSVINKYRAHVLQKAFKKSYSTFYQAYLSTKAELGVDDVATVYAAYGEHGYSNADEFVNAFNKNLKTVKTIPFYSMENYNGTRTIDKANDIAFYGVVHTLPDGSSYSCFINEHRVKIFIDTNGPKKPNKYGHDIFQFAVYKNSNILTSLKMTKLYTEEELKNSKYPELDGFPCSINSKQLSNGAGCSWYALNNINPDDETKTYWDNLPK
jgi:prepilin-type N-terminal cleavage/methylation domain-containing protein